MIQWCLMRSKKPTRSVRYGRNCPMTFKPIISKTLSDDFARLVESTKTDEGITLLDEVNSFGVEDSAFDEKFVQQHIDYTVRGVH